MPRPTIRRTVPPPTAEQQAQFNHEAAEAQPAAAPPPSPQAAGHDRFLGTLYNERPGTNGYGANRHVTREVAQAMNSPSGQIGEYYNHEFSPLSALGNFAEYFGTSNAAMLPVAGRERPYIVTNPRKAFTTYDELADHVVNTNNRGANAYFGDRASFDNAALAAYNAVADSPAASLTPEVMQRVVDDATVNAKAQHRFRAITSNAVINFVRNTSNGLINPNAVIRTEALKKLGLVSEQLETVYGTAAVNGFKANVGAKLFNGNDAEVREALVELGAAEEQASRFFPRNAPAGGGEAPGTANPGFQMPYLKDLPLWAHATGAGAAAAGAGALAAHLINSGQQQQDPAAYAAAIAAMNRY